MSDTRAFMIMIIMKVGVIITSVNLIGLDSPMMKSHMKDGQRDFERVFIEFQESSSRFELHAKSGIR